MISATDVSNALARAVSQGARILNIPVNDSLSRSLLGVAREIEKIVQARERRKVGKILRTLPFSHVFGEGYIRSLFRRWK